MILSATLSKPSDNAAEILGKPYEKIKIRIENAGGKISYFVQFFTKTQVFHEHWKESDLDDFLNKNAGKTFKNCVKKTENEEITILTNKKGKQTEIRKKIYAENSDFNLNCRENLKFMPQKKKNYILPEGKPVPFLVALGIMSGEGKVFNAKRDKFRQINKFLEFLDDAIDEVWGRCGGKEEKKFPPPQEGGADKTGESEASEDLGARGKTFPSSILKICDFGCGKSYLTFAIHYFLTEIRRIPCEIEGLDLKSDAIDYCNDLVQKLKLSGLRFKVGNIADYSGKAPDIVAALHVCDTAADFALKYAAEQGAKAILCVPCCQREINERLGRKNCENKKNCEKRDDGDNIRNADGNGDNDDDNDSGNCDSDNNNNGNCGGNEDLRKTDNCGNYKNTESNDAKSGGDNGGDSVENENSKTKADFENTLNFDGEIFEPLLKWGIIREKFASILTDGLRGKWLESRGYKVQMLEFIDENHTPKNILIRAVKKRGKNEARSKNRENENEIPKIMKTLDILPKIWN